LIKIFITIPWFRPAFRAGGPIQSVANLINEYTQDVKYYIFCSNVDLNAAPLENISIGCWVRFNELTEVWYASPEKISEQLVNAVKTISPDILYIIGLFSWHFNIVPLLFCKVPKKILSVRGMLHPGALSQKKWKKKLFLQAFRTFEYQRKVVFHATDAAEVKFIRNHFGDMAEIKVAGNFPNYLGTLPIAQKETGMLKLITIALISPMKNILMVLDALGAIEANVQYDIYGPIKDAAYWGECLLTIRSLPENISVIFHGELDPSKVKEKLAGNHVFIMPSKSENFGHSIFEALSCGRPVITSHHTPWNQLDESLAGKNISIDTQDQMINAINFFAVMDGQTMGQWHDGAIHYAANGFSMDNIRQQYREMFLA